jgi:hypothetical protein
MVAGMARDPTGEVHRTTRTEDDMSDFESALEAKLARNAELAHERERSEAAMRQWEAERDEARRAEEERLQEERDTRHAELARHLEQVARRLKDSAPESFIVRMGWTESGEEFVAKLSTRLMEPARSLLIELDRDDDEVLARWNSDVGGSLELWRLLEVDATLLTELVLQVADQDLWRAAERPPPFPG